MKMAFRQLLLTAALGMLTSAACAGTVGTLTTFTAGTAAKAAEVNGNFSALKTAVNASAADIATLQATVASQQTAVTALTSSMTALQSDVTALQAAKPTTTFAFGQGAAPQNVDSVPRFVGVTTTVTVAAGETLVVTSHFVPGWVAVTAGQTSNFNFSTCLRSSGSGSDPSAFGGQTFGAQSDHTAVGYSSAYVFTALTAGTYEVGMCGYGSSVVPGTWSSSGSRVVAQVFR